MVENTQSEDGPLFSGSGSGALRLALYTMAAVALMVSDHHGHYLDAAKSKLAILGYPILQLVYLPVQAGRWLGETFSERESLSARNRELERRWLLDQARLNRLPALESENRRLRELLDSSPKLGDRVLVAELLDVDLDPYSHRVVLNKGSIDGVYQGQPIADARGIVGQIESVTPISSFAMLISDPNHAIPVTISRTGLRTIAYGTGHIDRLVLRDLTASADIVVDDLVAASGLGGRFPGGFPVGKVVGIVANPGDAFLSVMVVPSAALDRSREVLLVWPGESRDQQIVGIQEADAHSP